MIYTRKSVTIRRVIFATAQSEIINQTRIPSLGRIPSALARYLKATAVSGSSPSTPEYVSSLLVSH